MERNEIEGVNLLRGNPKEAVKKLALPLMLSMMVISLYNIIDSFWIAGLGAGITSVVSKYIGAKNDKMADNAATHSVLLTILASIIVTVIFTVFARELLMCVGGRGLALDYAMQYGHIYFLASIFVVMPNAFCNRLYWGRFS